MGLRENAPYCHLRALSTSAVLCTDSVLFLSHYVTVGALGAGKDGDGCTHRAGGIGGGTAVLERIQGSEIGQCECYL